MKLATLGIYAVIGIFVLLLSLVFRSYALTVGFLELGLVFSIGGVIALVAQAVSEKRRVAS